FPPAISRTDGATARSHAPHWFSSGFDQRKEKPLVRPFTSLTHAAQTQDTSSCSHFGGFIAQAPRGRKITRAIPSRRTTAVKLGPSAETWSHATHSPMLLAYGGTPPPAINACRCRTRCCWLIRNTATVALPRGVLPISLAPSHRKCCAHL